MCNYAVSHAGFRPAAVLLHTPETDAVLLKAADDLGIDCKELPPLRALRESFWSFWESGKQSVKLLQPVISLQCPFSDSSLLFSCSVQKTNLFRDTGGCKDSSAYTNLVPSHDSSRTAVSS